VASISSSPGRTKFGEDPAAYDFARPAYPAELFAWLKERCSFGDDTNCLDIGAGTGLATLPILETPVRSILAIEPDAALAERLRSKTGNPRLTISVQRFEDAVLPDNQFGFAFAATSFHWLPRMKSLARVLASLKPGGWFAMWWSVYHDPARPDAFGKATAGLFSGLEQDPEATSNRPAFALDINSRLGELRSAGFTEVQHRLFSQQIAFTPERLAALYATFSRVRMAPEDKRAHLMSEVERIVREKFDGAVARDISVSAFVARKPEA
jgi:SAM-dependent methyltransferase